MEKQITKQEFINSMIYSIGYPLNDGQLSKLWDIYVREHDYKRILTMLEISDMYEQVK